MNRINTKFKQNKKMNHITIIKNKKTLPRDNNKEAIFLNDLLYVNVKCICLFDLYTHNKRIIGYLKNERTCVSPGARFNHKARRNKIII